MTDTTINELYTNQQAADYLGVARKAIRRLVMVGKLKPLRVGHVTVYTRKNLEQIKQELFAEGMTFSEIGNYYGVHRASVAHHFKRLGVKPVGRDNHRRGGEVFDFETVKKFAELLGWEPLPQSHEDERSDRIHGEPESH